MNTIDLMNAFKEAVAGSETSVFKRVKTMIKKPSEKDSLFYLVDLL